MSVLRAQPLLAAACLLLGLACLMPAWSLPRRAGSYLLAFDITQSMDVADARLQGAPVSRLVFAKHAAQLALPELPCGARVGWAIFTGYRVLPILAPLEVCAHYDALLASLEQIDGRMRWTNSSQVAKGLFWAQRAASALGPEVLPVFFTDGQEAPPLAADAAGPELPEQARALLIGVGGDALQPIPRSDRQGRSLGGWSADDVVQRAATGSHEELSRLDEAHLRALGQRARVQYARLSSAAELPGILAAHGGEASALAPREVGWVPALFALICLVVRCLRAGSGRAGREPRSQQASSSLAR